MTRDNIYEDLNYVNALRTSRASYAKIIARNPKMTLPLVEIIFMNDKVISPRAAWVFEFVFKDNPKILFPILDYFTLNLCNLSLDSSIRPCAKVIEILMELYYTKKNTAVISQLTDVYKERIIESTFDWMITEQKVAVKAYSMNSLFLLGTQYEWIHPELKTIIEREYATQSKGYQARTRHVLKKIAALKS